MEGEKERAQDTEIKQIEGRCRVQISHQLSDFLSLSPPLSIPPLSFLSLRGFPSHQISSGPERQQNNSSVKVI